MCPVHPPRPVQRNMYLCDNRFHTETLEDMLASKPVYGVVVADGHSATLATLVCRLSPVSSSLTAHHISAEQRRRRCAR